MLIFGVKIELDNIDILMLVSYTEEKITMIKKTNLFKKKKSSQQEKERYSGPRVPFGYELNAYGWYRSFDHQTNQTYYKYKKTLV